MRRSGSRRPGAAAPDLPLGARGARPRLPAHHAIAMPAMAAPTFPRHGCLLPDCPPCLAGNRPRTRPRALPCPAHAASPPGRLACAAPPAARFEASSHAKTLRLSSGRAGLACAGPRRCGRRAPDAPQYGDPAAIEKDGWNKMPLHSMGRPMQEKEGSCAVHDETGMGGSRHHVDPKTCEYGTIPIPTASPPKRRTVICLTANFSKASPYAIPRRCAVICRASRSNGAVPDDPRRRPRLAIAVMRRHKPHAVRLGAGSDGRGDAP